MFCGPWLTKGRVSVFDIPALLIWFFFFLLTFRLWSGFRQCCLTRGIQQCKKKKKNPAWSRLWCTIHTRITFFLFSFIFAYIYYWWIYASSRSQTGIMWLHVKPDKSILSFLQSRYCWPFQSYSLKVHNVLCDVYRRWWALIHL